MRRALLALATIAIVVTGAAVAAPVPVLTMRDDRRELVAPLQDGEPFEYSYEQSIYVVLVVEEFERTGDRLDLLRVRSPDIRALEYFRWDGEIRRGADGIYVQDAPPSDVAELVIRITPGRHQTLRTPRWTRDLDATFGESVVHVRAERRPLIATLIAR